MFYVELLLLHLSKKYTPNKYVNKFPIIAAYCLQMYAMMVLEVVVRDPFCFPRTYANVTTVYRSNDVGKLPF